MSYTFTGPHEHNLTIDKSDMYREAAEVGVGGRVVDVPAADLPEIVAALYRAAGQEPPIVLPRRSPEMDWVFEGGYVRTLLTPGDLMTPDDIRDLCSWYASAADLADAEAERQRQEAEREEVAALAEVIRDLAARDVQVSDDNGEAVARAILAAGYGRTEEQA